MRHKNEPIVRLFRRTKSICIVYVYRFGHKANVWANKIRFYTQINRFERLPGSKLHRQIADKSTRGPQWWHRSVHSETTVNDNDGKQFINLEFINKTQAKSASQPSLLFWFMCRLFETTSCAARLFTMHRTPGAYQTIA